MKPKPKKKGLTRIQQAATAKKRTEFLKAFAQTGTISRAARAAKIDRTTHYKWLESDPDYKAAFEQASEVAADELEQEARRRAIEGVDEPVGFYKGEPSAYVKRYSDTLLIFLLKGARPDKYRERWELEHRGRIAQTVIINTRDPDADEERHDTSQD